MSGGNTAPPGDGWQPMATAPTTGPVQWVDTWNGERLVRAHYAYGGGEDQPRFGPAWFEAITDHTTGRVAFYAEVVPEPTYWRAL